MNEIPLKLDTGANKTELSMIEEFTVITVIDCSGGALTFSKSTT
jgi:hypothetical protein